jgi:predicted phosphodiesterase
MKFLVLGDIHGNWAYLTLVIDNLRSRNIEFDAILQVGDFGFYNHSMLVFKRYVSGKINCPIYFIDGNHEDHMLLHTHSRRKYASKKLFHQKRGSILTIDDCNIGFVGGAFNVDRPQEIYKNGVQNFPSKQDIEFSIHEFNKLNKPLDLLITHSCPTGIGIGIRGLPIFSPGVKRFITEPFGIQEPPLNDCGDITLTELWNGLIYKPKNYMFGHFHTIHYKEIDDTRFFCVGTCDNSFQNQNAIFIFDTQLKKVLK